MKFFSNLKAEKLVKQLIAVRHHDQADEITDVSGKLIALGPSAVSHVIAALGNSDKTQTLTFVEILQQLLDAKSLPEYLKALGSDNQRIVSGVAWALAGSKSYDPNKLLELLDDPEIPKATLMQILESHREKLDARVLLRHAYELAPTEKEACMKLVGEMANDAMVPELLGRLDGKDAMVRVHIIHILARFRRPDVQNALQLQLTDRSKLVRQAALSALGKMAEGLDIGLLGKL
ncbi:MAG: HEAT repeat domain-containing protein, partial [Gammaproteobacteria bacterium]|nr:HEAT repeat domain-containing protein [Gammaproteobacteria bacterium]